MCVISRTRELAEWLGAAVITFALVVGLTSPALAAGEGSAERTPATDYVWRNVPIGGGGYVTGIVFHPKARGLAYIRTDVGGLYRWVEAGDAIGRHWVPLTDQWTFDEQNYYGIESVAVDPNDADVVYIAAGKYLWAGDGRIFKSIDRGATWFPLSLELPMAANGKSRHFGERLQVDPLRSDLVWFGSRNDGLWQSLDAGTSWVKVSTLPGTGTEDIGIPVVVLDPTVRSATGSSRILVSIAGDGIYESTSAGMSWTRLGGPANAARIAIDGDGAIFVTSPSGVFVFRDGAWTDVSPVAGGNFAPIAIAPNLRSTVLVATADQHFHNSLFLSRDAGKTWVEYNVKSGRITVKPNIAWWELRLFAGAPSALAIDPFDPSRVFLTDWYGVWMTSNYLSPRMAWRTAEEGREEMVSMGLATPPIGAPLFTAMVDTNGFRHSRIDEYPRTALPGGVIWHTFALDHHERDPARMVRVGTRTAHNSDRSEGGVAISLDNGRTWKGLDWGSSLPLKVAYSATDPSAMVVVQLKGAPRYSHDLGETWHDVAGVEGTTLRKYWNWEQPLAADRVDGDRFYLLSGNEFLVSTDKGKTFAPTVTLPLADRRSVEAAPGHAGHVWASLNDKGLWRSEDGGRSFERVPGVAAARLFSFGKAPPNGTYPAIFMLGQLSELANESIYRSDDAGKRWVEIADPEVTIGNDPNTMRGDRQTFGRVYIGTNGRGVFYGEPQSPKTDASR